MVKTLEPCYDLLTDAIQLGIFSSFCNTYVPILLSLIKEAVVVGCSTCSVVTKGRKRRKQLLSFLPLLSKALGLQNCVFNEAYP